MVTPNCLCGFLTETFSTFPQKSTVYFTIALCRTVLKMFFRVFVIVFHEKKPLDHGRCRHYQ